MKRFFLAALLFLEAVSFAQILTPEGILERVREAWQPASFHGRVILEQLEDTEARSWELEVWSGGEKALIRVLSPEEEAGSGYLVLGDQIWYYSPEVGFPIQLPELALAEGAFGGAAALEDLFRGALAEECEVTAEPRDGGWLLTLVPEPEAPVVWGRLELHVREDFALLEMRFFDQRGELFRTIRASEFIDAGGRPFPTVVEIEEADGDRAVERILEPELGIDIPDKVFTLEFLEGG
ncbi:outer membrane lipoprotein-sorting protein [Candidatus Bipolaricaulota bacterium]|nr:outer membrane lipoprotein-sorting protein [Candidatus Bipolaricaulota bacterium]